MISVSDLLILSQIPQIGPNRLRELISHFGTSQDVGKASLRELMGVEGFNGKIAHEIDRFYKSEAYEHASRSAERQLARLQSIGGKVITFWDESYPDNLKRIYDSPPFLFVNGDLLEKDKFSIAVVGTRYPTGYGIAVAEEFCRGLAELKLTIVSGLARGIDTVVHSTAVKSGSRTIAVIGSGLDIVYPPENRGLAGMISVSGAVISEYEMGTKPDAANFPRRNRIVSGLTIGTLVIETDIKGGAMITANMALDQNREVFAVPGRVDSKRSHGCNALIKSGRAKLVESTDDILEEISVKIKTHIDLPEKKRKDPLAELSFFEKAVYDALSETPVDIGCIAERVNLSAADVLVNLLNLEFKGIVRQLPGKLFVRRLE